MARAENDNRREDDTLTPAQRQWVDALRSGEYKQTTHVLCRLDEEGEPVGFCCLGVACDLAVKAGVEVEVGTGAHENYEGAHDETWPIRTFGDSRTFLPLKVRDWLGLQHRGGEYHSGITSSLAAHNDSGETFGRIADIIESRPTGLFLEASS